jgi:hypothetical protein
VYLLIDFCFGVFLFFSMLVVVAYFSRVKVIVAMDLSVSCFSMSPRTQV